MKQRRRADTEGDRKRKRIFEIYSNNLSLLITNGIITIKPKLESTYICPICLNHFSEVDLDQYKVSNPLTLEDAPPKSLGGKANVLTCKECNNKCGANVDYHLVQQMTELDIREFRPGVVFDAHFEKDGRTIQGRVIVSADRIIKVYHANSNNHPQKLEEHVVGTGKGSSVQIKFKKSKVEERKIQLALLKTGYLLTFAKYGYAFILDPTYDRVRKQLLEPNSIVYPLDFWFNAPFPKKALGAPFVIENNLESILATFELKTPFSERMFSTIIPLTSKPIENVIRNLKARFNSENRFTATLDSMDGADYLKDISAIKQMLDWIQSRRS